MDLNKEEVWKMKEYAKKLGVEFRFDTNVTPKFNGSKEPCNLRISPQEVIEFDIKDKERFKEWRRFCKKFPQAISSDLLFNCGAGKNSFYIDSFANLYICRKRPKF